MRWLVTPKSDVGGPNQKQRYLILGCKVCDFRLFFAGNWI